MSATVTPPYNLDKFDDVTPFSGDMRIRAARYLGIVQPAGQLWERVAESTYARAIRAQWEEWEREEETHAPVDENTDGIPDNCAICGRAVHTNAHTGKLTHGFDPAL